MFWKFDFDFEEKKHSAIAEIRTSDNDIKMLISDISPDIEKIGSGFAVAYSDDPNMLLDFGEPETTIVIAAYKALRSR